MEEENKYDQESIRELLSWAQNTLNNKTYPEGELVLDKCIKSNRLQKSYRGNDPDDRKELGESDVLPDD